METIIQEQQLEAEIQELYILSRHLAKDVNFSEGEVMFLSRMLQKYLVPVPSAGLMNKACKLEDEITEINMHITPLRNKVATLSELISLLVNKQVKVIGMNLLEQFFTLEAEVKSLFEAVTAVKKHLFVFVDDVIDAEPHDLLSIS